MQSPQVGFSVSLIRATFLLMDVRRRQMERGRGKESDGNLQLNHRSQLPVYERSRSECESHNDV